MLVWIWHGLLGCLLSTGPLSLAATESVRISWNANPERNIAGYEVRYGSGSRSYSRKVNAGKATEVVIDGLEVGVVHYFAVRAYNRYGLRGPLSEEVSYGNIDSPRPPRGRIVSPATDGSITVGQTVDFAASAKDPNEDDRLSYHWSFGEGSGIPDFKGRNPGKRKFSKPGTYQVTLRVVDSTGLVDATPETRTFVVRPAWNLVPQAAWRLKYVDSEEAGGFAAVQSFDGNPSTFWHTRWSTSKPTPPPHQIQIDLGEKHLIRGFQYLPRQDGATVGTIRGFKFYVSMDGKNWGKPIATGKFATGTQEKRVFGTPKRGRYIRLVGESEVNGNSDCSVAELNVIEGRPDNRAPVAHAQSVSTARNKSVSFSLSATDRDRNPISYKVVTMPKHGKLKGTVPNLTYQPEKGFTGVDEFTYRASDGLASSKPASVKITVKRGGSSAKSALVAAAPAADGLATAVLGSAKNDSTRGVTGSMVVDGEKFLTLTLTKPSVPDGLKRRVEVSPNLVDWFSGRSHTSVVADNERFLTVRDNTPITPGRKRYIRVRTTVK